MADLVSFSQKSLAFPFSGYFAMRNSWKPDADSLFLYNRRSARGHSMAAANLLQLGAFGRRLLVAVGIPNYEKADTEYPTTADSYRSESSKWKTNTIESWWMAAFSWLQQAT